MKWPESKVFAIKARKPKFDWRVWVFLFVKFKLQKVGVQWFFWFDLVLVLEAILDINQTFHFSSAYQNFDKTILLKSNWWQIVTFFLQILRYFNYAHRQLKFYAKSKNQTLFSFCMGNSLYMVNANNSLYTVVFLKCKNDFCKPWEMQWNLFQFNLKNIITKIELKSRIGMKMGIRGYFFF